MMVWWLSWSFCRDIDNNDYILAEIWLGDHIIRWLGEILFLKIRWFIDQFGEKETLWRAVDHVPCAQLNQPRASRWNLLIYCDFARTYVITMISPKQYLTRTFVSILSSTVGFFFNPTLIVKVIQKCCSQQAFINKFWFFHASHENISMCGCTFIYAPMCLATSTHDASSSCECQDIIFFSINFTMIAQSVLVDKCTTL